MKDAPCWLLACQGLKRSKISPLEQSLNRVRLCLQARLDADAFERPSGRCAGWDASSGSEACCSTAAVTTS
jgi:hypothetical protein